MSLIDTGDTVLHIPTGEEWIVACVEDGKISWCGWPEGWANIEDCKLVKAASDDDRYDLLVDMSNMPKNDHRQRYAEKRLKGYED